MAIFVVVAIVVYGPISDSLTISSADPAMIKLAQDAGMNRKGELIFLRTHPQLDSDSQIETDCGSLGASFNDNGEILQGCYITDTNRIYIRQMPSDYANLEITTAAYEVLHPIYQSLTESDTSGRLNKAVEAEYAARSSDYDLTGQVGVFDKTEPGAKDDELFSILGTQYSDLSPTLAAYYTPYFYNLSADVTLNQQELALIPNLQAQLNQLNNKINTDESDANIAYADSVSWANVGNAYEDTRNYNIYTQDFNTENQDIAQYNQLVQQFNTLRSEYTGSQPVSQKQNASEQSQ